MALLPVIAGFVAVPDGSGGGAVAFADITGSPSDNAALQSALDAKADDADVQTVDTGWGANASTGDPSVAVQNWSSPNAGGSDLVSQSALQSVCDHVVNLTKKVQALQATAFANKRPNVA